MVHTLQWLLAAGELRKNNLDIYHGHSTPFIRARNGIKALVMRPRSTGHQSLAVTARRPALSFPELIKEQPDCRGNRASPLRQQDGRGSGHSGGTHQPSTSRSASTVPPHVPKHLRPSPQAAGCKDHRPDESSSPRVAHKRRECSLIQARASSDQVCNPGGGARWHSAFQARRRAPCAPCAGARGN